MPSLWPLYPTTESPEPDRVVIAQAAAAIWAMDPEDPLYEVVVTYWANAVDEQRVSPISRCTTMDEYIEEMNSPWQDPDIISRPSDRFTEFLKARTHAR